MHETVILIPEAHAAWITLLRLLNSSALSWFEGQHFLFKDKYNFIISELVHHSCSSTGTPYLLGHCCLNSTTTYIYKCCKHTRSTILLCFYYQAISRMKDKKYHELKTNNTFTNHFLVMKSTLDKIQQTFGELQRLCSKNNINNNKLLNTIF